MIFKYVMFKVTSGSIVRFVPVIFPELLVHSEMADYSEMAINGKVEPRSAGFVSFDVSGVECYGESESLKLKSHPDDTVIVRTYNYSHGIGFD